MRALILVAAAGLGAVAIGFCLNSDSHSAMETSSFSKPASEAISILEIHNQAHLEFLSVQKIEDQSVIYTEARRQN